MKINRDARVWASDGEFGSVRHVIVDAGSGRLTDIIVGDGVREWIVPTSAIETAGGDVRLRGSVSDLTSASAHFDHARYHGVDAAAARDESRPDGPGDRLVQASDDAVEVATGDGAAPVNADGPYELQLRAERPRLHREEEAAGQVRLRRQMREHVETIEVPIRVESMVIECLPGSGRVLIGNRELGAGESIELTLRRERAIVEKEMVATEEVHIRKDEITRNEQVRVPLRQEQLTVDDPGGLVAGAGRREGSRSSDPSPGAAATGAHNDMYDPTPEPAEYDTVRPDHERVPVMEDPLNDEHNGDHRRMTEVERRHDQVQAESASRKERPRPAASGQLNPGAQEYTTELPDGPAGTDGGIDSGVPQPAKRAGDH